jgi:hypothetical protein
VSNFSGVVQKTFERHYGGKLLHSFVLQGVDGLFKLGETAPKFKEGAYISFSANSKNEVDASSIDSTYKAPDVAKGNDVAQKAVSDYSSREEQKQASIHYQSSRKDAIEVVKMLLSNGSLALGAKKAAQVDEILGYVDFFTERFFKDANNLGHSEDVTIENNNNEDSGESE